MRVPDLLICVSVTALWAAAAPLHAQEDTGESVDSITVRGEVLSTFDGRPLSGVLVALHDLWKVTRTDELGYFEIPNVPLGPHELGVYALGYLTLEQYIDFFPDEVLAVKLDVAPIQIEGIQVAVLGNTILEYRSFGTRYDFIGGDLLEEYKRKYGYITDMIRARFPGVRVHDMTGTGQTLCVLSTRETSSLAEGSGCAYMLIDGLQATGEEVAQLNPEFVASIRYVTRMEGRLVYGALGENGVLLIETVSGKARR
ncbi:MAG: carboxypeptidase-like regulatory domain-containing protein [Gemmatimonadetes bacterium]|nr:carboxypeptidase-like regulatory domain-containing protein [Gemmatimonadota bacterium]